MSGEIQAGIFDFDGTCVLNTLTVNEAFVLLLQEKGIKPSKQQKLKNGLIHEVGRSIEKILADFIEMYSLRDVELHRFYIRWDEIYRDLVTKATLAPRPGLLRVIEMLHGRQAKTGVATGSAVEWFDAGVSQPGLKGIKDRMSFCWFCPKGSPKPSPVVHFRGMEGQGFDASKCLVFEDSAAGKEAAIAAGLRVIIVYTEFTQDQDFAGASLVVPSFDQITEGMLDKVMSSCNTCAAGK